MSGFEDEDVPPVNETQHSPYVCGDASYEGDGCPYTCVGLAECQSCGCAVAADPAGPWGRAMDVIMCLLPILFLVVATVPPLGMKAMTTSRSLPLSAFIMFLVRLMYLGSDPLLACGSVVKGVHEAITPLSIMAGAICLFETMESTRCLPYMMREMKALTRGRGVAELAVIFAFATMVEGASGFGTPQALGAPMLISLGHGRLESVVALLLMNTFVAVFGAAGTPIWYGFGSLGLSGGDMAQVSFNAAVALVAGAFLLVPFVFAIVIPLNAVKQNIVFVLLSMSGVMLPMLAISFVSYEFPSLLGGIVGLGVTAILTHCGIGLGAVDHEQSFHESGRHPMDVAPVSDRSVVSTSSQFMSQRDTNLTMDEIDEGEDEARYLLGESGYSLVVDDDDQAGDNRDKTSVASETSKALASLEGATDSQRAVEMALGPRKTGAAYFKEFLLRTSPITLTVLMLIVTRIPQIGLNSLLKSTSPRFSIRFGTYATFRLSASLVFQLEDILSYPGLSWKYELLYTPFLLPFVLVSGVTYLIYREDANDTLGGIFFTVYSRVKGPAVALCGALTLVQLMVTGDESAPASVIGVVLSDAFQEGWIVVAAAVGALGSFFSGSTTVSNLTFGSVQQIAAEMIGADVNAMLALQVVGASAGNGVCLNNIISACTVTGLAVGEGEIIARTAKFVLAFVGVATLVMLPFLL